MINDNGETMVEHHIHYKEIHGFDETKWMTKGEHNSLHHRLRKDGECNVPAKELNKISSAAYNRTDKMKEYYHTDKWKEHAKEYHKKYNKEHRRTDKQKEYTKEYQKNNIDIINFYGTLMSKVRLHESLTYNNKTGTITWLAGFRATSGKKLFYIDTGGDRRESDKY